MTKLKAWRKPLLTLILLILSGAGELYAQDNKTSVPIQSVTPQKPQQAVPADMVLMTGTVKDTEGEVLPGVNIYVRETKGGSVTDSEGNFTLSVPRGKSITIDFSYVGMKTLTRTYDGKRAHLNQAIVLQADTHLEEVVVTGLFYYKSSTFTGSTA